MILLMIIPQYLKDIKTMGIMVYSLVWVMQDLYQQPYSLKVLAVVPMENSSGGAE